MNLDILNNIEDTYDNITTTPEVGKCYEKIYKNGKIEEVYLGRFVMRETDNLSDTRWQSMNPNMIGIIDRFDNQYYAKGRLKRTSSNHGPGVARRGAYRENGNISIQIIRPRDAEILAVGSNTGIIYKDGDIIYREVECKEDSFDLIKNQKNLSFAKAMTQPSIIPDDPIIMNKIHRHLGRIYKSQSNQDIIKRMKDETRDKINLTKARQRLSLMKGMDHMTMDHMTNTFSNIRYNPDMIQTVSDFLTSTRPTGKLRQKLREEKENAMMADHIDMLDQYGSGNGIGPNSDDRKFFIEMRRRFKASKRDPGNPWNQQSTPSASKKKSTPPKKKSTPPKKKPSPPKKKSTTPKKKPSPPKPSQYNPLLQYQNLTPAQKKKYKREMIRTKRKATSRRMSNQNVTPFIRM